MAGQVFENGRIGVQNRNQRVDKLGVGLSGCLLKMSGNHLEATTNLVVYVPTTR